MSDNKDRLTYRPEPETKQKIERWYQADNCRSKNEFIEKAVNCYADMLAAGESTALPRAVQSAIDSRLKLFEVVLRHCSTSRRWRWTWRCPSYCKVSM